MLQEISDITQYDPGKLRRWFHDDYFDLYTWENNNAELLGFQLCYAKRGRERALRWSLDNGYAHDGVDTPEEKPGRAMSAIFVADGVFDSTAMAACFQEAANELPENVRNFVLDKILAYQQAKKQGLT